MIKNCIAILVLCLALNSVTANPTSHHDSEVDSLNNHAYESDSLKSLIEKETEDNEESRRLLAALDFLYEHLNTEDSERDKRLTYRYGKRMTYRYGKRAAMPYRFGRRSDDDEDQLSKRLTYRYGK